MRHIEWNQLAVCIDGLCCLRHRLFSVWSPHANGAECLAHVGEGHRAICWHVLLEPVLVASTVECTGDHTEVLLAKAHDGEVSTESTTWGEQWCVDRTANSNINIVYTDVLQEVDNAWAFKVELVERGEVHHSN